MKREWAQARLTGTDVKAVVWILVIQSLARGYDYALGFRTRSVPISIEEAMPLWVWGAIFFAGGLVLGLGMLFKIHPAVWLGHAILWLGHLALFVGAFLDIFTNPLLGSIRGSTVFLLTTVVHGFLMVRTGIRPLTHSEMPVKEEAIVRPGTAGEP